MTTATNWLLAIVLGTLLAAACNLDTTDDIEAPQSPALSALQNSEAGSARRDSAGQALCIEAKGPGSTALWTPQGDLVCRAPSTRPPATGRWVTEQAAL